MRRVIANSDPKNDVVTDLDLPRAVEILRASNGNSFVRGLVADFDQRGWLPERREAWAIVIAHQVKERASRVVAPTPVVEGSFASVVGLLTCAVVSGKKFPKIFLRSVVGESVVLSLAGSNSRYVGSVQLTDGERYPDNRYYGRVSPGGELVPGKDMTDSVWSLLVDLAVDPVGVITTYGRETGVCAMCGAELTDERSILAGIGPICAVRHGLPWGDRPVESARGLVLAGHDGD